MARENISSTVAAILASAATILALTDGEWMGLCMYVVLYIRTYVHTYICVVTMLWYHCMCCTYVCTVRTYGQNIGRDNSQDTG